MYIKKEDLMADLLSSQAHDEKDAMSQRAEELSEALDRADLDASDHSRDGFTDDSS